MVDVIKVKELTVWGMQVVHSEMEVCSYLSVSCQSKCPHNPLEKLLAWVVTIKCEKSRASHWLPM